MDEVWWIFRVSACLKAETYCQGLSPIASVYHGDISDHRLTGDWERGEIHDPWGKAKLPQFLGHLVQHEVRLQACCRRGSRRSYPHPQLQLSPQVLVLASVCGILQVVAAEIVEVYRCSRSRTP